MKVRITYNGFFDIKGVKSGESLELEDGITVDELLDRMGLERLHRKYIVINVNGKDVDFDYKLKDEDHLNLHLMIGGG